jgi:hypothetical protein
VEAKRAQDGARMLYVCSMFGFATEWAVKLSVVRKSEWSILITTEFSQYELPGLSKIINVYA